MAKPKPCCCCFGAWRNCTAPIQDGAFRSSLPSDRGELFNLLKGMEKSGGWPYIPRLQLRTFMDLLQNDDDSALAA